MPSPARNPQITAHRPLRIPKQERFCELIAYAKKSVEDAYVEAGYTPDQSNAYKLRGRPEVEARIEHMQGMAELKALETVGAKLEEDIADREWIRSMLIYNAKVCLGIEPLKRKIVQDGKEIEQKRFVHQPNAAARSLNLLGMDIGMFNAEMPKPMPKDVDAARSAADPRIAEQLDRYRKKQTKDIPVISGGKKDGTNG